MTTNRISFPELALYTRPDHPLAGRYLIEREIGAGGMAFVFAARDLKHGRVVAVKVLRADIGSSLSADRFTREIQIAAGLTHPNILPVHDSGAADGLLYYVMPYVEGGTLVDRMTREGRLPMGDVRRITRDVGAALQFAHAHGIVHRDIKPENVLLPGGVAVVADFGLARAIESTSLGDDATPRSTPNTRLTQIGIGLGTPAYMSPEQGAGEREVDARSDQYSLACMVYEMLVGRPPFEGPSYQRLLAQHITETPPRLRTLRPEVPESVDSAIARALSKNPDERFASVDEFLRALDGDAKGQTASWGIRSAPRWLTRRSGILAAAFVGVAIVAVVTTRNWGTLPGAARALDPNLIAVAPFTVFGTANGEWREGLVDVLARDFDGAGPLRTVSPSMVLRRTQRTIDRAAALELAKSTGAGIVVYGQLLETGPARDSVRARVTVHDVAKDSVIGEFEVMNAATRMDLVADSIALRALRQLGNGRSIAAVPRAYFGSRSLPALKLFLQGEQHYRKNDFPAAKVDYEQAIALDSGFALAYRRMRGVLRGISGEFDSLSLWYAARAGAENRGSSLRDSLLILADSLAAVHRVTPAFADGRWIGSVRRRLATLDAAAKQYPDDPEVWTELGEGRVHYGDRIGLDNRQAFNAFERAIRIDSVYGPAFFHAIDLALQLGDSAEAGRLIDRYIRINPSDRSFTLVREVFHGASLTSLTRDLDAQSSVSMSVFQLLARYSDANDMLSPMYTRWLEREGKMTDAAFRRLLSRRYAFRGRLNAAASTIDTSTPRIAPEDAGLVLALANAGVIPRPAASRVFAGLLQSEDLATLPLANSWWFHVADSSSIAHTVAVARRWLRDPSPETRGLAEYAERSATAYLMLLRRDTTEALRLFLALPDSAVSRFLTPLRIDVAQILLGVNRPGDAAAYLDRRPPLAIIATIWDVQWNLARARAAKKLGDSSRARSAYTVVAGAWNHPDPSLRGAFEEARAALR